MNIFRAETSLRREKWFSNKVFEDKWRQATRSLDLKRFWSVNFHWTMGMIHGYQNRIVIKLISLLMLITPWALRNLLCTLLQNAEGHNWLRTTFTRTPLLSPGFVRMTSLTSPMLLFLLLVWIFRVLSVHKEDRWYCHSSKKQRYCHVLFSFYPTLWSYTARALFETLLWILIWKSPN